MRHAAHNILHLTVVDIKTFRKVVLNLFGIENRAYLGVLIIRTLYQFPNSLCALQICKRRS